MERRKFLGLLEGAIGTGLLLDMPNTNSQEIQEPKPFNALGNLFITDTSLNQPLTSNNILIPTPIEEDYHPKVALPGTILENNNEYHAIQKCSYLWPQINIKSYNEKLARSFVQEHYRFNMNELWFYSLAYAWSGSDLNPKMRYEPARGLMDTWFSTHRNNKQACLDLLHDENGKEKPWNSNILFDPWVSIRLHCIEAKPYWIKSSEDPWQTLRSVFLPASPNGGRAYSEQRKWKTNTVRMENMLQSFYA